jgi:hypothetical protein
MSKKSLYYPIRINDEAAQRRYDEIVYGTKDGYAFFSNLGKGTDNKCQKTVKKIKHA